MFKPLVRNPMQGLEHLSFQVLEHEKNWYTPITSILPEFKTFLCYSSTYCRSTSSEKLSGDCLKKSATHAGALMIWMYGKKMDHRSRTVIDSFDKTTRPPSHLSNEESCSVTL